MTPGEKSPDHPKGSLVPTVLRLLTPLALVGAAAAGSLEEQARELARMNEDVHRLFAERAYEKAEELCRRLVYLTPDQPGPHYNLACALARQGKTQEALAALEMAVLKGFGDPDHVLADEDLASLRPEARFARCVAKARENARTAEAAYEPGGDIVGVKTVEAAPPGGLRYRLRMSTSATPERPDRLIVWLHPAGGSGNEAAEGMALRLAQRGYALMVLTQKDWRGWSALDLERLVGKTLPQVATVPGIDAARPLLMGYSAGGQAALALWQASPERFGALILDAAYPVRPGAGGRLEPMQLPEHPAARRTPFFVLVGEKDGGAQLWQKLEPSWRAAGVPLTLHIVPGQGHAWLFGPKQVDDLMAWLEQLKAGKLPGER